MFWLHSWLEWGKARWGASNFPPDCTTSLFPSILRAFINIYVTKDRGGQWLDTTFNWPSFVLCNADICWEEIRYNKQQFQNAMYCMSSLRPIKKLRGLLHRITRLFNMMPLQPMPTTELLWNGCHDINSPSSRTPANVHIPCILEFDVFDETRHGAFRLFNIII